MAVRPVLLVLAIAAMACKPSQRAPAAPTQTGSVGAYVVDGKGPVAGLDIRLVALPDGRCPCAKPFDTSGLGNEMPACACPEALASWQARLAACEWPAHAIATVETGSTGTATLERPPGVTGIEVARGDGVRWLPWPKTQGSVSLELEPGIAPRVHVTSDSAVAVHGAFLFDDGHCVPLDKTGDLWVSRVPLPRYETTSGTLVVEAPGYATIVYSLFDQEDIELELHRDKPVSETCDAGAKTARLDNPFQHLVTKVERDKPFTFTGVIDMASKVSCWASADEDDVTDEWDYSPEYGFQDGNVYGGTLSGNCEDIKVVDTHDRRVVGAEVSLFHDQGGGMSSGTGATTDERGIACVEDLDYSDELVVHAPPALGGQCAGELKLELKRNQPMKRPLVVRLRITPLKMMRPRGRLVSAEGAPVAGAYVNVGDVAPSATPDCTSTGDASVRSGADGTFVLPPHPRGTLSLAIHHDWYTDKAVDVANDGTSHDIVLSRGEQFAGRVLDPDGKPITECSISLKLESQRLLTAKCGAGGAFAFSTITPGKATIDIRLDHHPLGTFRTLTERITFEAGKPLALDVQFPRGEDISGRVIDSKGNAIAGARLNAIPKGARDTSGRFDENEMMLEADASGRFTFKHMRSGTWLIRGDKRTGRETTMELAAGTKDVVFVVPDPPQRR